MEIGRVCEQCDAFNELGASVCQACGAPLTDQGTREDAAAANAGVQEQGKENAMEAPTGGGTTCPNCGAALPEGFKFCGKCGTKIEDGAQPAEQAQAPVAKTLFFGAMQTPGRAKLILIKGQGQDGMTYYLSAKEHVAGRSDGEIQFPDPDPLLSPVHANFYYDNNNLFVRDEESTNGVFIRITGSVPLTSGDTFLVGEQLLRVEKTRDEEAPAVDGEGTYFYSSPTYPSVFQVVQILHGGSVGRIFRARGDKLTIGREGNDLNFPDDPFISGHHAQIEVDPEGEFRLTDMGSKNGTFFRLPEPTQLSHGDYVFLGQQLLRVEIT